MGYVITDIKNMSSFWDFLIKNGYYTTLFKNYYINDKSDCLCIYGKKISGGGVISDYRGYPGIEYDYYITEQKFLRKFKLKKLC